MSKVELLNYENDLQRQNTLTSKNDINLMYFQKDTGTTIHKHYLWNNQESIKTWVNINNYYFKIDGSLGINSKHFEYYNQPHRYNITTRNYSSFLSFTFPLYHNNIAIQTGIGVKKLPTNTAVPKKIGLAINPYKDLELIYARSHRNTESVFKWSYPDSSIKIFSPRYYQSDRFKLKFSIKERIRVNLERNINRINSTNSLEKNKMYLNTQGKGVKDRIGISYLLKSTTIKILYKNNFYNSESNFRTISNDFGSIDNLEKSHQFFNFSVDYQDSKKRIKSWFTLGQGNLSASGNIESWPITSVWADYFALQSNSRLNYSYNFLRSGIQYEYSALQSNFCISSVFETIKPEGEFRTWQPVVFGIGVQNLQVDNLALKSQKGLYFSFHWSKKIYKNLKIKYQLAQYIPLYSRWKKGKEPIERQISSFRYGGANHSLELQYYY